MQKTYWENCLVSLNDFENMWNSLRERILKYPCVKTEGNTNSFFPLANYPLVQIDNCVQTVREYADAIDSFIVLFRSIDQETAINTLFPQNIKRDLNSAVTELTKATRTLSKYLTEESFLEAIKHKEDANFCINLNNSDLLVGNTGKSIGPHLVPIIENYDKAIITLKTIIMLLDKISPLLYKDYVEGKKQYATELVQLKRDIKSVSKTAKEQAAHIQGYFNEIEEINNEISALKNTSNNNFNSIESILNESKTTQVNLNALVKSNESLKLNLEELQMKATNFNNDITNMRQSHTDEMKKIRELFSDLTKRNSEFSEEIKSLTEEANAMLSGATNAALASAFDSKCKEASEELSKALSSYNSSIKLLWFSTFPLAFILFFMSIGKLSIQPWTILPAVILVMPGLFLQHFAASRYADTFRILEDYTYKYSIAMGVEGYKKAAPEYADEIAASTFEQISFNPADNMRGQKQVRVLVHPALELLTTKMGFSLIKAKTLSPELLVKIFIDKLFQIAVKNNMARPEICEIAKDMLGNMCSEDKARTNR